MLERDYQSALIEKIRKLLPGCFILKNDSGYLQGVPDLLILYGPRWGMLEVKTSEEADEQPNQRWYINHLDQMSFAAFIYPEIEKEVLDALQYTLAVRGKARNTQR